MRTNIELDDRLIDEARRLTGLQTKKAVVEEALRVLIASRRRRSLLDLEGKIRFADGYDHKTLREDRAADRTLGPAADRAEDRATDPGEG
jgi:Arc/MetJ family transcription regulator